MKIGELIKLFKKKIRWTNKKVSKQFILIRMSLNHHKIKNLKIPIKHGKTGTNINVMSVFLLYSIAVHRSFLLINTCSPCLKIITIQKATTKGSAPPYNRCRGPFSARNFGQHAFHFSILATINCQSKCTYPVCENVHVNTWYKMLHAC